MTRIGATGRKGVTDSADPCDPHACEQALAAAIAQEDEELALETLALVGRKGVEFSCRCFSLAITTGMVRLSLACARAGFHLSSTDEPAARKCIAQSSGPRGLADYLSEYRYCKAKRTYYLAVVESHASNEPVRALLEAGLLPTRDMSELLNLSLRHDRTDLARVLVQGGARLSREARTSVPDEIKDNDAASDVEEIGEKSLWREFATPRASEETLNLVLERVDGDVCPVYAAWFNAYGRSVGFARKLALIVMHSDAEHCEDASAVLSTLAANGELKALRTMLGWNHLDAEAIGLAYETARKANAVEAGAILLASRRTQHEPAANAYGLGLGLDQIERKE